MRSDKAVGAVGVHSDAEEIVCVTGSEAPAGAHAPVAGMSSFRCVLLAHSHSHSRTPHQPLSEVCIMCANVHALNSKQFYRDCQTVFTMCTPLQWASLSEVTLPR